MSYEALFQLAAGLIGTGGVFSFYTIELANWEVKAPKK